MFDNHLGDLGPAKASVWQRVTTTFLHSPCTFLPPDDE
jgi:hypothetical protein